MVPEDLLPEPEPEPVGACTNNLACKKRCKNNTDNTDKKQCKNKQEHVRVQECMSR